MADRGTGSQPPQESSGRPLASLTPEQHRIVAYASAIGSEFDFQLLVGAMGIEEETLAEEIERLGLALLKLNDRMQELKTTFGLSNEDLEIDLGPLGRLR